MFKIFDSFYLCILYIFEGGGMTKKMLEQVIEMIKKNEFPRYMNKFFRLNNNFYSSMKEKYFWCSKPIDFNDPFECQTESGNFSVSKDQINNGNKEVIAKMLNSLYKDYTATCFADLDSNKANEMRLWTFYADEHKGVSLKIDIQSLISFWINNFLEVAIQKVRYQEEIPKVYVIINEENQTIETNLCFMYTKTKEWIGEQEIRVFYKNNYLPFPIESIKEFTFGCKCSTHDSEKKELIKLGYKHVKFYKLQTNYGSKTFSKMLLE